MRAISTAFRDAAEASHSGEVALLLATIDHPSLLAPVRVCSDIVDYVYGGETYYGMAFTLSLLTDDEQSPKAKASIPNADQRIGEAVLALPSAPTLAIVLLSRSDFDDGDPRQPLGTPVVEWQAPLLYLRNVTCDAMTLEGDIVGHDITTEVYPSIRSTAERLPGLYK